MEISLKKIFVIIVLVFLTANVVILDILLTTEDKQISQVKSSEEEAKEETNSELCEENCRDYTDAQIEMLVSRLSGNTTTTLVDTSVKEIYIPLGTGASTAKDWTSVAGLEASIDSSKYPQIANSTFEVTVNIPNDNQIVWIRLYNQTANHPVWFSEMEYSGAQPGQLISPSIQLDEGNNTYIVQAKTQLGYEMQIVNARAHLTLK